MTGWIAQGWRRLPALGLLADRETAGFLGIAALVGVAVGAGAALLIRVLEGVALMFSLGSRFPWWAFLAVPAGITAAWHLARTLAPEAAGDGVPEAAAALAIHGGRMRARAIPVKIMTTALTLGGGGSAGREGPIVQIGSNIGSVIAARLGMTEDRLRSLVAAGAAAGIGATFNAPIAGMLFALEVILRSFAVRHMSAIVIASVTAAVTSRSLIGQELALQARTYVLADPRELLLYGGLALLAVPLALAFLRTADGLERFFGRRHRWGVVRPLGVGLMVATVGFFEPRLLGTGQDFLNDLLQSALFEDLGAGAEIAWWTLVLLAVGKVVATSLTMASGGSGGAFMPSLFIGATLGSGLARLAEPAWTISDLKPGAFAVVGMATMFAAVARAPLTAMLIVFEVTGARDYGLVLPLMLSAILATFLADRALPESVYTLALRRRGIQLAASAEVDILDIVQVGEVMAQRPVVAAPPMSLTEVSHLLQQHRLHGVPVVEDGRLVGILTSSDIVRAGGSGAPVTVREAMTKRPVTISPSAPVSRALERMAALGVGRLPVVADDDSSRLVGLFRREEAVTAYHRALGARSEEHLIRERLQQRTAPGVGYFDFRVPPGSIADGKRVHEVTWPEACTLVSVHRGRQVVVPSGDTILRAGDLVTAFGTEASQDLMIERLNAGADEPTAEVTLEEIEAALMEGHERGQ